MYVVSDAVHEAIQNGNEQMPLLIFKDGVFTSGDIDIDNGITFNDYFNLEEDLSIGQALSNELRFSMFNDYGYLDDYEFGELEAMIGVMTAKETYTQQGNIMLVYGNNTYIGNASSPYITRNGTALAEQPSARPANIILYDGKVYSFQVDGTLYIYDDTSGERVYITGDNVFDASIATWVTGKYIASDGTITSTSNYKYTDNYYPVKANAAYAAQFNKSQSRAVTVALYDENHDFIVRRVLATSSATNGQINATFSTTEDTAYMRFSCGTNTSNIVIAENMPRFMLEKFKKDTRYGAFYRKFSIASGQVRTVRTMTLFSAGYKYTYEFIPLGVFIADRPNVPSTHTIDFNCNDRMMLFERDMPGDDALGITYPCTIGNLYEKMCSYLGVERYGSTSNMINYSATISKRPEAFDSATMRDVLKWIAEAAGSNAKFNRDGKLQMVWLNTTSQSFGPTGYKSFNPYWYKTSKVTKLENRASDGSYDNTSGTGDETYLIQDNPLLRGVE